MRFCQNRHFASQLKYRPVYVKILFCFLYCSNIDWYFPYCSINCGTEEAGRRRKNIYWWWRTKATKACSLMQPSGSLKFGCCASTTGGVQSQEGECLLIQGPALKGLLLLLLVVGVALLMICIIF